MSEWLLVDCLPMVSDLNDLPTVAILSEEQLRGELKRLQLRSPASIIELVSPEVGKIRMGVGRPLTGIRWMKEPLGENFRMAVADRVYSLSGMEFRFQGSVSGFRPEYLLPVEKAIEAAVHFYKTGELPDSLQWTEWNPQTDRLQLPVNPKPNGVSSSLRLNPPDTLVQRD